MQHNKLESFDVINFLKDQGCFEYTEAECEKLVQFFDSDQDGFLSYNDFQQMFLTSSDNYLRGKVIDRPAYNIAKD